MKETMYCLSCSTWEPVVNGGHAIYLPPFEDEPAEIDWCSGPFTYSEPPETDPNEFLALVEPSPEELEAMNAEAG